MSKLATAITALVLAASAGWADPFIVKNISDGFLNVRSGPGTTYDILRRVYPGDQVESIEQKGRWVRIGLQGGGTGWISGNFLKRIDNFSGGIRTVVQTSDGYLNLRSGPGTSHGILRRIYPGDQVLVLSVQGNWLRVRTQTDSVGWVYGKYVK
ncbi:MAG: SH3 domain-containing protein [Sulfitobacter sp.]